MIRPLTPQDIPAFREIRRLVVQTDPLATYLGPEDIEAQTDAECEAGICGPLSKVYGVFDEGHLLAIAGMRMESLAKVRHRAFIWGVYTLDAARGQGHAKRLLSAMIDALTTHHEVTHLTLVVHSQNAAAIALYGSLGFVSFGVQVQSMRVAGQWVDELWMQRIAV